MKNYVIALDQGTTSSRAIIFDSNLNTIGQSQSEFRQIYVKPGWVEHDPMEIFASQYSVLTEAIMRSGISIEKVAAIGITNQRETTIVWDRNTGLPVYNAIVWQCRRTASMIEKIKSNSDLCDYIRLNTGLIPDAYFSATKLKWILENVEGAKERAKKGELLFGTVDTWLLWKMTDGKVHATDQTNASRTMLYNIKDLCWDERILNELEIPKCMLPEVKNSSEIYGYVNISGHSIAISGIAGDQQAALFGQACFKAGQAKNTYGTGCFMLMNTGDKMCLSKNAMLTTIAIGLKGKVQYAIEGSVFTGGSVIQWLRDELRVIAEARDAEYFASKVDDTAGVYFVPAFNGLGAPHWDMYARGALLGITRGTRREHIIRAALEAIAYQSKDLLDAIVSDTSIDIECLKVDGGACTNEFLMQFQSDIINRPVERPENQETTSLGAAFLAGLSMDIWDRSFIEKARSVDKIFIPDMTQFQREKCLKGWGKALSRAKNWEED